MDVLSISLTQLNNVLNAIFLVHTPAIEVATNESTDIMEKTEATNSLLSTFANLGHAFYNILALATARPEQILYPHFTASYFPGRDFYGGLERCEHLF